MGRVFVEEVPESPEKDYYVEIALVLMILFTVAYIAYSKVKRD